MRHINYKTGFLSIIICFLFAGNTPAMAYEDNFQNPINPFQINLLSVGIVNHPQQAPKKRSPFSANRPQQAPPQKSPFSAGISNGLQQAPPPPGPPGGPPLGDAPVGNGFGLLIGMSIAYGCFLFYRRKGKLSYRETSQ